MLRYNWTLSVKRQHHKIQLQMDTILRFFGTGSGRLVVDGTTVHHWGCNPLRMIPKGSYDFEVDGRRVSILSRFTATSLFFLVVDGQEILPIEAKQRKTTARRKR